MLAYVLFVGFVTFKHAHGLSFPNLMVRSLCMRKIVILAADAERCVHRAITIHCRINMSVFVHNTGIAARSPTLKCVVFVTAEITYYLFAIKVLEDCLWI